ncbi:tyrosine-protein kinase SRK3, partial [Biomphalaria glabrata]
TKLRASEHDCQDLCSCNLEILLNDLKPLLQQKDRKSAEYVQNKLEQLLDTIENYYDSFSILEKEMCDLDLQGVLFSIIALAPTQYDDVSIGNRIKLTAIEILVYLTTLGNILVKTIANKKSVEVIADQLYDLQGRVYISKVFDDTKLQVQKKMKRDWILIALALVRSKHCDKSLFLTEKWNGIFRRFKAYEKDKFDSEMSSLILAYILEGNTFISYIQESGICYVDFVKPFLTHSIVHATISFPSSRVKLEIKAYFEGLAQLASIEHAAAKKIIGAKLSHLNEIVLELDDSILHRAHSIFVKNILTQNISDKSDYSMCTDSTEEIKYVQQLPAVSEKWEIESTSSRQYSCYEKEISAYIQVVDEKYAVPASHEEIQVSSDELTQDLYNNGQANTDTTEETSSDNTYREEKDTSCDTLSTTDNEGIEAHYEDIEFSLKKEDSASDSSQLGEPLKCDKNEKSKKILKDSGFSSALQRVTFDGSSSSKQTETLYDRDSTFINYDSYSDDDEETEDALSLSERNIASVLKDLEVPIEAIKVSEEGKESYRSLLKGFMSHDIQVAVKVLKTSSMFGCPNFKEAVLLKTLRHPNIVQILGVVTTSPFYIIMELPELDNLSTFLQTEKGQAMKINEISNINMQIARGMVYLQEKKIIHRALTSLNILIGKEITVKISEFSQAILLGNKQKIYKSPQGLHFPKIVTAPEALWKGKFSFKSDVWSFGVIIHFTVTLGRCQLSEKQVECHFSNQCVSKKRTNVPIEVPTAYLKIMSQCCDPLPDKRPSFHRLKQFFEALQI